MSPSTIIWELRYGQVAAARDGLFWLILGATATMFVVIMLTPSIDGLSLMPYGLREQPSVAHRPNNKVVVRLTNAQRIAARRTAVRVALTQVGVREQPGNRGKRLIAYRRAVLGSGENPKLAEPWCADFVSWAWRRSGVPIGFGGLGSDYVPELVAWARVTMRWHWARTGFKPRAGDIVVYSSGGSRRGHMGLVVKVSGGRVHTVEGNFRDQVMRRQIKGWEPAVTGYISPV